MEIKIKIKDTNILELEDLIKKVKVIEKEYSCNCTLLEIESSAI